MVDSSENVWVLQYHFPSDTPERWDVFDPSGVLLGAVELPPAFSPLEVGGDYVLGVWQDADDVEHVRLYELEKPQ